MTADTITPKKNDASPFQRLSRVKLGERPPQQPQASANAAEARTAANNAQTAAPPTAGLSAAVSNISETSKSLREISIQTSQKEPDRIKDPPSRDDEVEGANREASTAEVRDVEVAATLAAQLNKNIQIAPEQAQAAQVEGLQPKVVQDLLEA